MDWAEDLKNSLKMTVKKGRRAGDSNLSGDTPSSPENDFNITDTLYDNLSATTTNGAKALPMKIKKVSGWADDSSRSSSGGKNPRLKPMSEVDRFNSISRTFSDDDIPVIPDQDDVPNEKLLEEAQITEAVVADRVETYKELNSELLKYSSLATSQNIDLSILMKCLQNDSILNDKDEPSTMEQLFQEVASHIHSNQMKNDEPTFIN